MAGTTNMNIVLSGGSAVKEIHNTRKQSLDLNQQYVVQNAESRKKKDKEKIQEVKADNRIEIGKEKENKNKGEKKQQESDPKADGAEDKAASLSDRLIDIVV